MHQRYGKLPWKDLFQSAIAYAEQGFPVTEAIQESWAAAAARIEGPIPNRCACFFPAARLRKVGDLFRNPDIGHALRLIAEQGPAAFYKGEIAAAILKTSRKLGGTMTAEDLAGLLLRMGDADFDRLSRLENLRASAQQPGHGRARDAEHHGGDARLAARRRSARRRCTSASRR